MSFTFPLICALQPQVLSDMSIVPLHAHVGNVAFSVAKTLTLLTYPAFLICVPRWTMAMSTMPTSPATCREYFNMSESSESSRVLTLVCVCVRAWMCVRVCVSFARWYRKHFRLPQAWKEVDSHVFLIFEVRLVSAHTSPCS